MTDSRRSKRNGDNEAVNARNRSDSVPSSSSRRKSSKKIDTDRDGGFNPTSTSFSSISQSPYPGMAAPSVASSYATANTMNPANLPYKPPDLIRNQIMQEQSVVPNSDAGRESRRKKDSDRRRDRSSDNDTTKSTRRSKRPEKEERRRGSRKEEKVKRTDSERALDNHRASMVENQFPGEFPSTFAEPYRPPGLAADYYGDHGESVASQPGVRPVPPSILIAADQAHLHEATVEAAPPPEPSSLGQVGAAASFYGGTSDFESDPPPKPSKNGKRPSVKPARQSTGPASLRSSPGLEGRPGLVPYSALGVGPAGIRGPEVSAGPVVGEAAEYFSTQFNPNLTEGGSTASTSGYVPNPGVQKPTQGLQNPVPGFIRPPVAEQRPSSGSNIPLYGAGAAAAGIAAAGAGAYYASHHTTEDHHAIADAAAASHGPQNTGPLSNPPQNYQSQTSTQQRRRRRGPFSKIVDFFQDASAVAEYEAYTEAIGVCKYCFEPGSSPRDAPRKHHYKRRSSDGRYASSTRVDKLYRYQSSEDEKRRRSNGKKWVATGLAGYGLAKMSEAATNRKNDFDDTYSIKSGRPEGLTRVSFAADEQISRSRRTRHPSGDDQAYYRGDFRHDNETKVRKDKSTGELYQERLSRRRRDSGPSDRFSKGAAISAGVVATDLATAAGHRSRSNSPTKRYYTKRVSPNHSYVDLSTTSAGGLGFGSFFSSPSANQRKGKKPKGLGFFNFNNASSSSSDADLAFGAGSVRRKKGRRDDRKIREDGSVHTQILGLAATGVALAAEADRQDRKGKRRADLLVVKESRNDLSRRNDKRRVQSPASESVGRNDDWIDASDDDSSVDSALAYGGRLSARQSRESLGSNDGTDKWAWRWNNGKKRRKRPSQDPSHFQPAVTGLAGSAVNGTAIPARPFGAAESTASLQSMQQLDPIPMSDTNAFIIDRKTSAVFPMTEIPPPILSGNKNAAALEHPQPFAPISQAVYSVQASAPTAIYTTAGPPQFPQYAYNSPQAPMTESPKQLPLEFEAQQPHQEAERRRRRNSSPTPSQIRGDEFEERSRRRMSTRESVKFDLTEEQAERERRTQTGDRRRSRNDDGKEGNQGDISTFPQEASLEGERDEVSSSRRSSTDARTARELEIERELERLYEEDRRQKEARKSKRADTWPAVAAEAVGVGATVAAQSTSAEDEMRVSRDERQSRRKSAMKQITSPAIDDDRSDSQQRRIARMAAARVKSTSSPVHEDYANYFVPPELAENIKQHNFAAQHRDDLAETSAQIVEVAPRTAQRKDTFDPFLYRPFGIEPEDDPRRHPWPVPLLDIIEPTPPVSVRGDMSPLPAKSPEPPELPDAPETSAEVAPERNQKRSSSVTWGEHRTHEYDVVTPLEDHEEFVRIAAHESSPAIDLVEGTHSDPKPELSEPVTANVRTSGVQDRSAEDDGSAPADLVEGPQPKANYGQDIEFAAVLAAAAEGAGFDPSIVVNDPIYHRRDSPPGSGGASFYRSPFAETVSDLGTFHDYSVPPPRGFVEGEIPPTLVDEGSKEAIEPGDSKEAKSMAEDEQVNVEPKIPGGFNVSDYLDDSSTQIVNPVDAKPIEKPAAAHIGDEGQMRRNEMNRPLETYTPDTESVKSQQILPEPSKQLRRSSTLDEVNFEALLDQSSPQMSYVSDPEGFGKNKRSKGKSSKKGNRATEVVMGVAAASAVPTIEELVDRNRRRRKLEREEDDYYDRVPPISASEPGADPSVDSKKLRRKSKRDSDIWDDTRSVASSPAEIRDDRGSSKKSKKRSKRDGDAYDDDTVSVCSLPADLNGDKASSRKSKEKKSGGFFGLFSSSKSEDSTSLKRSSREMDRQNRNAQDTQAEEIDESKWKSKRTSKSTTLDDESSDLQPSQSDLHPSVKDDVSQHSPEEEFVSSEEAVRDNGRTEDGMPFLGERPEMPTVLDGVSGSTPKAELETEQGMAVQIPTVAPDSVSNSVRSRSVSPRTTSAMVDDHEVTSDESKSPSAQQDQLRQRHLSEIRTSDMLSSPLATGSPTAVPLLFRRLPVSPGFARSASVGSTSADSPLSPLVTPRTRQGRPTSTEFRNSKEFRPLYLVERHSSIKQPNPEIEETYPSLPSSRTSSAHPSMENLRGDEINDPFAEQQISLSQIRDRRHSFSYWRDERPRSPDYLDSRTATPIATEFPKEFKREKPKYEFHSPSELLEDPSRQIAESQEHQSPLLSPVALPSVGSPESPVAKNDSAARPSRPSSPAQDQHSVDQKDLGERIGLGLTDIATVAVVPLQLVGHGETAAITPEDPPPKLETPQELPLPFTSSTRLAENGTPIDPHISCEVELSSATQTADDENGLQSIPSKKSKKDKKKKVKMLDVTDESVHASSRSVEVHEESANVDSLASGADSEQVPAAEGNVRDLGTNNTISSASLPPQSEGDVVDNQTAAHSKGAEVQNTDISSATYTDIQALPDPITSSEIPVAVDEIKDNAVLNEAPSGIARDEDAKESEIAAPGLHNTDPSSQNTLVDKSFILEKNITTSEISFLPKDESGIQVSQNEEPMPAGQAEHDQQDRNLSPNSFIGAVDDSDRIENLNEKASYESYPFDERIAAVENPMMSPPSALKEAFAKAEAARGTAPEVSEEEAFQAFQPRIALEASLGLGHLETIAEGSREGSKADLAEVDGVAENLVKDLAKPSTSKSKKDKKKDKKSKKSVEVATIVADPEDVARDALNVSKKEEAEIMKAPDESVMSVETAAISDPSINPFGDDYVLHPGDDIDNKPVHTGAELDKAGAVQLDDASGAAAALGSPLQTASTAKDLDEPTEESSWTQTSKKNKKKSKKGRTSTLISEVSTPVTEMSSTESIDQPQGRQLDTDSSAVSAKKGKKNKKKKVQAVDWTTEDAAPEQEEALEQAEEPLEKVNEMEQYRATQATSDDLPASEGKKGKKNKKKKVQAVDWTAEDAVPEQEEALEQAEEPLEKVNEMEQYRATQAMSDDSPASEGKKAKKNKKSRQALDWTDEGPALQPEDSFHTTTESQGGAPVAQGETEDLAQANTTNGKKEKKAEKPENLQEMPNKIDVALEVEPILIPATVDKQVPRVNDKPQASVPGVPDKATLLRNEPPIYENLHVPSLTRDEASIPRDVSSTIRDETQSIGDGATPPQLEQPSSEPTEVSQLSPSNLHELDIPKSLETSEFLLPEFYARQAHQPVGTIQSSSAELEDQQEPQTVIAKDASDPEDRNGMSDPCNFPPQAQELLESQTLTSEPSDDHASALPDSQELSELSKGPQQTTEVGEDSRASTIQDPRWASVLGELKQRKTPEFGEVPQLIDDVDQVQQVFTPRNPAWLSVFGELKQRKVPVPAIEDSRISPGHDIGQETPSSVPAEAAQKIDSPTERIETAVATDPRPDYDQSYAQMQGLSPEQAPECQIGPSPNYPQAHEQAHGTAIEAQDLHDQLQKEAPNIVIGNAASHEASNPGAEMQDIHDRPQEEIQSIATEEPAGPIISQPFNEAQGVHDRLQEEARNATIEEPASPIISHPVGEAQAVHDRLQEEIQNATIEEPAGPIISHPVSEAQGVHDQLQEEARNATIEEPAGPIISHSVSEAQGVHDRLQEEARNAAIEEPASPIISHPVGEAQTVHDRLQEDIQNATIEEPAGPIICHPVSEAQGVHDRLQEEARNATIEELADPIISHPVGEAQGVHDRLQEEIQNATIEEPASPIICHPVGEAQEVHGQLQEEIQNTTIEEPASPIISHPVSEAQEVHGRLQEEIQNATIEEPASPIISHSVSEAQEVHGRLQEDIQNAATEEPTSPIISHSVSEAQEAHDRLQEEIQNAAIKEPVSHAVPPPITETQDMLDQVYEKPHIASTTESEDQRSSSGVDVTQDMQGKVLEEAHNAVIEELVSHKVSEPTEVVRDIHDQTHKQPQHAMQESMMEIFSQSEQQPQEAIVSDSHGVSDRQLQSDLPETSQLEPISEPKQSDGEEMLAGPSHAPTQLTEEQTDELSSTPTAGKRKKDKKKPKRRQSTFDEVAEPSSDSSRAKDIIPISTTPRAAMEPEIETAAAATPAEEAGGDVEMFSLGAAKKSKKDKKKKKSFAFPDETSTPASNDVGDVRSSVPLPASPAHLVADNPTEELVSQEMQVGKEIHTEDEIQSQLETVSGKPVQTDHSLQICETAEQEEEAVIPQYETVQEHTERNTAEPAQDSVLIAEPATMREEPDEYSWAAAPKKKNKKDKKKRDSLIQTSGSATPQMEDEPPLVEDTADPTATQRGQLANEDDRAPSSRKSKKDKKKKKKDFNSLNDVADPKREDGLQASRDTSRGIETEIDQDTVGQTQDAPAASITEQESGEQTVRSFAPELLEAKAVESPAGQEAVVPIAGGGSIADHVEEEPAATKWSNLDEDSISDRKAITAREEESSWAPALNPRKEDRGDDEVKPTNIPGESLEDTNSSAVVEDVERTDTVQEQDYRCLVDLEVSSAPARAASTESITETGTPLEPQGIAKQEDSVDGVHENSQQSVLPSVDTLESDADDDAGPLTTKKGRREKKTKQKSVVDLEEQSLVTVGAAAAGAAVVAAATDQQQGDSGQSQPEHLILTETREAEKEQRNSSEPSTTLDSAGYAREVLEHEEDTSAFPTKKSKKVKKKKRQSTIEEYSSTPSAPTTPAEPSLVDKDIVIPVDELNQTVMDEKHEVIEAGDAVPTAASASLAQVEEDLRTIGKKSSKKDKKKKKKILPWSEENDTSMDQSTATSTPRNEPEPGILGKQMTARERKEEPTSMLEVKSIDPGLSPLLESAMYTKRSLPGLQQHFNATKSTTTEAESFDAQDLRTEANTVEAEEDVRLTFLPAKKNKKSKQGKKGEVDPTFSAAENVIPALDSREDAQSQSFSIQGALEDVAEPESWAMEVPDVSAANDESSSTPAIKEPKISTETVSEHAVLDGDSGHPSQFQNVGLGVATVVSEAGAPQAIGGQPLTAHDQPLGMYESQRSAVHDQATIEPTKQYERAVLHSDHKSEMLPTLGTTEIRSSEPTWSFATLREDIVEDHVNRDSGIQVPDSPPIQAGHLQPALRDSGYVQSPVATASREIATHVEDSPHTLTRPPRPISPTSSSEDLRQNPNARSPGSYPLDTTREMDDPSLLPPEPHGLHNLSEASARGHPSPVDSTTKDRSSALFNSSPSNRTEGYGATPGLDARHLQTPSTDLHRSPSVHGRRSREDLPSLTPSRSPIRHMWHISDAPIAESTQEVLHQPHRSIFGPFPTNDEHDRDLSPPRTPLQTIHEHAPETSPSNRRRRPLSDVGSPDRGHKSVQRSSGPAVEELHDGLQVGLSGAPPTQTTLEQSSAEETERGAQKSAAGNDSGSLAEVGGVATVVGVAALAAQELRSTSRDEERGDTKSLGKSKSRSTSSKQLRHSQSGFENIASSSTHDPVREKGKAAARDMADVYNGYGEFPGSPMSPTRPPSVRSRRSMQQLKDLEAKLDQLASENRLLATAKINAEQQLQDLHIAQSRTEHASQEALELRDAELREKDEAIAKMREALDTMQREVARLTEVNEGLMATHEELRSTHEQRYSQLEEQHAETHEQWQESSRELEDLRSKHAELSTGMEEIVRHELDRRLAQKDAEIQHLFDELEDAKAKIRELQQQILAGQGDEIIVARDEDYFDNTCQKLCQHVQQWVLRYSKFSDTRVCRLTDEVRDEKVVDRFDNAILDGSDVDLYLRDRVKRRDVFMSVVMTMIWEYIFTRYLFGMDREQRQKLKLLEKNLSEVGPQSAVHRWRAMTLTLLSKRQSFKEQRASDTEAVVQEIYSTLARFLPPPQHLQGQIQESLRNVMKTAVDLSIEMRTQRAEYIMLPPLQPEYDLNGDLARKVYFNAALMNERSGETSSNDELEAQHAVVRMVLFPLVVKKGSDAGEGDEEIVVCPAQVLVARPGKDKRVVKAVSGDRMSIDQANRSVQSFAPSVLDPTNVI